MKDLIAIACLVALTCLALTQFLLGVVALAHYLGVFNAIVAAVLCLRFRFTLPLRIGTFLGAMYLWHWHWPAALLLAAPRALLMLPGLTSTTLARLRHPPPVWHGHRAARPMLKV